MKLWNVSFTVRAGELAVSDSLVVAGTSKADAKETFMSLTSSSLGLIVHQNGKRLLMALPKLSKQARIEVNSVEPETEAETPATAEKKAKKPTGKHP